MLGCEEGVGGEGGRVAADHVYVGGLDVVGVEETHDAGDHAAPVAALGYCIVIRQWLLQRGLYSKKSIPYLSYPSFSMSLWHVSAY